MNLNMKQNLDGSESGIIETPPELRPTECEDIIKRREKRREYNRKYRLAHKEYYQSYNKNYFKNYYENNKETLRRYNEEYRLKYKSKLAASSVEYYEKNKVRIKNINSKNKSHRSNYNKQYYNENKTQILKYKGQYLSNRYKTDSLFKIKHLLRSRLNDACKERGFKKSTKTIQILGCSYEQFKLYIESLFIPGMNWTNYGKFGWHIDHIIPLAHAKTQQELETLCHYKNLQPLWWNDNLRKGARIITKI